MRAGARGALLLLLAASALVACGKKGPPVAPEYRVPLGPSGLHGAVDEQSVVVSWTGPDTRVDGTRLRAIALYKLYRREEANGGEPKSAMLSSGRVVGYDEIATIRTDDPAPATVQGTSVTWVDRRALAVGRRYIYVVTAEDTLGRSSAPSERLVVPYLAAPKAPRALSAAPGDRRIGLTWQPPAEMMDGSPAPGDLRYLVLRGAGAEGALAAITPKPLEATSFTDEGLENDTDYRYAVRAVRVDPAVTATGETSVAGGRRGGGHHAARRARQPARGAVPGRGAAGLEPERLTGRGALRDLSRGRDRRFHAHRDDDGDRDRLPGPRRAARRDLPLRGHRDRPGAPPERERALERDLRPSP